MSVAVEDMRPPICDDSFAAPVRRPNDELDSAIYDVTHPILNDASDVNHKLDEFRT